MERTDNRGRKFKLTDAQHKEIERRYLSENISQGKLAKEYGVSQGTICRIVSPKTREKMQVALLKRYYSRKEERNERSV